MGFFDDFAEGFGNSFAKGYESSSRIREATEAEDAKAKAKAFLANKKANDELRREDQQRIANAKAMEKQFDLPEGAWVNVYQWDAMGFTADKILELAQEGTFKAIPVPDGDTNKPATEGAVPTLDDQTNAALGDTNIPFTYTTYANNNGRTGDPTSQQNQAIVDLVASSMTTLGEKQVKINSGFRGHDEHNHDGNAFDIDVSHMDQNQRLALVQELSKNGAKGIGFGNNSIHVDIRGDRPRIWWYDAEGNDVTEMPEALAYSKDALLGHTNGAFATGSPTDPTNVNVGEEGEEGEGKTFWDRVNALLELNNSDTRAMEILGVTEEEYEAGAAAYVPDIPELKYTYVPKTTGADIPTTWNAAALEQLYTSSKWKSAETPEARMALIEEAKRALGTPGATSAEQASLDILYASQAYVDADAEGKQEMLRAHKETWSNIGKSSGSSRTAKQIALDSYMKSDAYTGLDETAKPQALADWERKWKEDTEKSTSGTGKNNALSMGKIQQRKSDAEAILVKPDATEEEKKAAQYYLDVTYQIEYDNFIAGKIAEAKAGEPPIQSMVTYTNADGKMKTVAAIEVEGGYIPATQQNSYNSASDEDKAGMLLPSVSDVATSDQVNARTKAITSASGVYEPVLKTRSNVSVAAQGAFALDRMAARNDAILTRVAGAVSMFEGGKKELITLMEWIKQSALSTDPRLNSERSILAGLEQQINGMVGDGQGQFSSAEVAQQYKEFSAAVVRYVFAAGKALGQSGNGFSNADYTNILSSIVNANSYAAFSKNLRNLTVEQMTRLDADVESAEQHPMITNALRFPVADEIISPILQNSEEFFGQSDVHGKWYKWAKRSRDDDYNILNLYSQPVTDADIAEFGFLAPYKDMKIIIFADGTIEEL